MAIYKEAGLPFVGLGWMGIQTHVRSTIFLS
jgi:hypothetical protein